MPLDTRNEYLHPNIPLFAEPTDCAIALYMYIVVSVEIMIQLHAFLSQAGTLWACVVDAFYVRTIYVHACTDAFIARRVYVRTAQTCASVTNLRH